MFQSLRQSVLFRVISKATKLRVLPIVSCLLVLVVVMLSMQLDRVNGQDGSNPTIETDVIARLNAWRISENIAPLKFNPELQKLALQQAQYLVALKELPHGGELHKDSNGELPPQRAYDAKWPNYGMSARTAVGENAAVGDAKFALHYWLHSEIHKKTALNPAYREIGVAAIPYHHKDYMIIAVFGARPDYLPAFLFPEEGDIYFTNEQYKFKSGGKWIQNVTRIELYDANGKPLLPAPIPFVQKMPLPTLTTNTFDVVYMSGKTEVRYTVSVNDDITILPHHQKAATVSVQQSNAQQSTGQNTAQNSGTKSQVVPPTNTPRPATRSPLQPPPTNTPHVAGQPTIAPTQTNPPTESPANILKTDRSPEIMILYDDDALVIVNDTDKPADISNLKLRYQGRVLETKRWSTVVSVPLDKFPADHCLMLELSTASAFLPEACTVLRSVISVNPDRLFWQQGDFEVLRGDKVVGVCKQELPTEEDHCEIPWN